MRILGISAFYHDSAAALIDQAGSSRRRRRSVSPEASMTPRFHTTPIAYCLAEAGVRADSLDQVVFYDKPFLKFERLLETYIAMAPRGFRSFKMSIPLWLREKLFQKGLLRDELEKFCARFRQKPAVVLRAPSEPRGLGVLSVTVRQRRRAHHGRGRRMGHHLGGDRQRQSPRDFPGNPFSAFARAALLRADLLYRLQGQLRRVQGDGARPLRRAEIRQTHSRQSDRSEAGWLVPARHVLLRLLHRFHHDQRSLCRIVWRAGAKSRSVADAVPHGRRGLDPVGA